jgi:predicted ATPase
MKIESIRLKNFRSLRDAHLRDLPNFCVVVGANGSGKSTLFAVFDFLRNAMNGNVNTALMKLGGNRGFQEVRSRGSDGPIEIELKLRAELGPGKPKLISYELAIDEEGGRAFVAREVLKYRRGSAGQPWHFIDFARGAGEAVTNELESMTDETELKREAQTLKSPDLLAIKALAQFEKFPAAVAIGTLIDEWHLSDFHVGRARAETEAAYAEHLSIDGGNLSLVIEYLNKVHPSVLKEILGKLARRVPGITSVETKVTEEGRVLLKFQDGAFEDPFLAKYVSDGTIKMLMYLVLLHDPTPHPLLCIEEPENQLYPSLLERLAEDFRAYADRGGQVFVSTHSPDFLNAVAPNEAFWLVKEKGYTSIRRASDDPQIAAYIAEGDQLGFLWKQGLMTGADPG